MKDLGTKENEMDANMVKMIQDEFKKLQAKYQES